MNTKVQSSPKQSPITAHKTGQKQQNEQLASTSKPNQNPVLLTTITTSTDMNTSATNLDGTPTTNTNVTTTTTADGTIMEERRVGKRFIIKKAYPPLRTPPTPCSTIPINSRTLQQQPAELKTQQTESLEQNIVLKNKDNTAIKNEDLSNKEAEGKIKDNSQISEVTEDAKKTETSESSGLSFVSLNTGERRIGKTSSSQIV